MLVVTARDGLDDRVARPLADGGVGWDTINTNSLFLAIILAVVVFLTVSKADRIEGTYLQ